LTPERWNDRDAGRRARTRKALRQVWWALIPIWSIGFLSFVPFLAYALIQRSKKNWAVVGAYLAATIAIFVSLGVVNPNSGPGAALGGFIVALAGCAAVHAAVLFRPSRAVAPLGPAMPAMPLGPRQRNQQALAAARDRIERRKEARHLVASDPDLAREMRIGRPDLSREYDDGGLIDVNHVPGDVLTVQLGLAPGEVTDVLAARDKLGKFASADELCAYTELSPDRVDELRDLMIFA
jgi:hypothetical protein